MNWLLAITVLFVLLIAACGIWMNAASKSVDKTVDFGFRVTCYDAGLIAPPRRGSSRPTVTPAESNCIQTAMGTAGQAIMTSRSSDQRSRTERELVLAGGRLNPRSTAVQ